MKKIIGVDALAEIASGSWHERNRRAVENGMANIGKCSHNCFCVWIRPYSTTSTAIECNRN